MPMRATVYSHVTGGVVSRLAQALTQAGVPTRVVASFSPERWRAAVSGSPGRRALTRLASLTLYPAKAVLKAGLSPPHTAIVTTNPFVLPLVMVATRRLHGCRTVVLVYDLYPDALEAGGLTQSRGSLARLATRANRYWLSRAEGVVFIGQQMARHAQARYGTPARSWVIETGASTQELSVTRHDASSELGQWLAGKRCVISYVGNMGLMHDWHTLRAALPTLRPLFERGHAGLLVAASGPGAQAVREAIEAQHSPHLRFAPPLDDASWIQVLAASAVSLVTLRPEAAHTCVPSKAFSALAAGSALLAVASPQSDLAQLITQHHAGCVVQPGDSAALTRVLQRWLTEPALLEQARHNARALARSYDAPALAQRWRTLLEQVTHDTPRPEPWLARPLDVAVAATALVVTAPLLVAAALAVRATLGSPVLFCQERPGLHGQPFTLLKLRTMRHARPGEEGPGADATRLTPLGRFLRATSLDELPTLLNVLAGDMSLVGPRPLLMRYLPRYSPAQARRHLVRPGITGWAQVNGRNALSWHEKFVLDTWYVDNRSLGLNLRILARTAMSVLRRQGISQDGHATMPEFEG